MFADDVACMVILFQLMGDVELRVVFFNNDCYDALVLKQAVHCPWVRVSQTTYGLN
jgi:hypothetical protein